MLFIDRLYVLSYADCCTNDLVFCLRGCLPFALASPPGNERAILKRVTYG